MSEPVAVGVLGGDQKVYVVTKAIIPPKPLHARDPKYPEKLRKSRVEGEMSHFIVDDLGRVRFPESLRVRLPSSQQRRSTPLAFPVGQTQRPASRSPRRIQNSVQA